MNYEFSEYLTNKSFASRTITTYKNTVERFKIWAESENIPVKEMRYNDLLVYVNFLTEKGNKKRTINLILNAITHFYNYLKEIREVKNNPCEMLRIKNVIRKIPHELLSDEKSETIYKTYPEKNATDKRNKITVGLLVYQGLSAGDLQTLEIRDVNLNSGKINVPANGKNAERTIDLKVFQILKLQNYIQKIRPELLKISGKQSDKLLITSGKSKELRSSLEKISKKLRKLNPEFRNLKQIRASVITNLLKHKNIREVQYFAGHKYVSSTERYLINNIEDLKKETEKYHPLNKILKL